MRVLEPRVIRSIGRRRRQGVKKDHSLFNDLDSTGQFHRDSPVGRIFHPGTVSFREISSNDSLHITVSPGNRVSVHVDRLSPLDVRPGHRCRYSLVRALGHNVVHAMDTAVRFCGRRGARPRCHLDCEVTIVDDATQDIYEFSCKAAGAKGCRWSTRAHSEEELVANVAEHARRTHGVKNFSDTIAKYALQVARPTSQS